AQMQQVLWNLVRNGVQASPAGSNVVVSISEHGQRVSMAVSDEGPGIDADAQERIFDAFFTTRSQGAGIGLAVVRRIIEDHAAVGASIEIRSRGALDIAEKPVKSGSSVRSGATFEVGLARAPGPGRRTEQPATSGPSVASDRRVAVGANARSRSPKN